MRIPRRVLPMVFLLVTTGVSIAQPVPDYGLDWVTVGDPGNRPTRPEEVLSDPDLEIGAVAYPFRLTRTNINNIQMLEFVRAYAPFWGGPPDHIGLTTRFIYGVRQSDGSYEYVIQDGAEHWSAQMGWETAARYCNWLTNGKVNEAWAFESGAYDTTTFTDNGDGSYNHQVTRSPGALFWIPSLDEFTKGAYWDPAKDGVGGYWRYPNSGDEVLIEGLPEDGGETIGDILWEQSGKLDLGGWDLEQYPWTLSPWGLLDVGGSFREWTETPRLFDPNALNNSRVQVGSIAGDATWFVWDRIDQFTTHSVWGPTGGALRVASIWPVVCRADLTNDGILDVSDLALFLDAHWLQTAIADWNGDGDFDFFDAQLYLNDFAAGCP